MPPVDLNPIEAKEIAGAFKIIVKVIFKRGISRRDISILKNVVNHWDLMNEIFGGMKNGSITINYRPDGTIGDRDFHYKKR